MYSSFYVYFLKHFFLVFFLSFFKSKYHKIPIEGIKTKRDGYGDSIDSLKLNLSIIDKWEVLRPLPLLRPTPFFSPQAYITTHPSPITTCIRILKIVELVGFFVCWFLIDKENKKDAFTLKYVMA